jgi:hypothetical protein
VGRGIPAAPLFRGDAVGRRGARLPSLVGRGIPPHGPRGVAASATWEGASTLSEAMLRTPSALPSSQRPCRPSPQRWRALRQSKGIASKRQRQRLFRATYRQRHLHTRFFDEESWSLACIQRCALCNTLHSGVCRETQEGRARARGDRLHDGGRHAGVQRPRRPIACRVTLLMLLPMLSAEEEEDLDEWE